MLIALFLMFILKLFIIKFEFVFQILKNGLLKIFPIPKLLAAINQQLILKIGTTKR